MKRFYSYLILAALLLCAIDTRAQIFIAGTNVIGTATGPVLNAFVPVTNTAYSSLLPRTLVLSGISSNETAVCSYGYAFAGVGGSTLYVMNTITTNLNGAGFTNGATVTIPVSGIFNAVPIQPWGTISVTNASGNVTNNVLFY
jgi:hypothetical protein